MLELLVTTGIAGVALGGAVKYFATQLHQQRQHAFRIEAQQAARSSLDAITRDLRLAGACLPSDGQFIALAGANIPGGDSITIRTGLVRTNMSCIVTSLAVDALAGATTLTVGPNGGNGFTAGMLGYVRHPNGSGEIAPVTAATANSVTFSVGMGQAYPSGSGVYAIDERTYGLDKTDPSIPKLTLTVNRAPAEAFAAGVDDLQISYVLDRNCPTCDVVPLPINTAEWRLVNDVDLSATVKTVGGVQASDQATLTITAMAKPRNLLP
jgi:type II secretory pathway pseudopilin PulG